MEKMFPNVAMHFILYLFVREVTDTHMLRDTMPQVAGGLTNVASMTTSAHVLIDNPRPQSKRGDVFSFKVIRYTKTRFEINNNIFMRNELFANENSFPT